MARIHLLLRSINGIDLGKLWPHIIVRHQRFYTVIHRSLNPECGASNTMIDVGGPLTGERKAVVVTDDIVQEVLAAGSQLFNRMVLPVNSILDAVYQIVDRIC